MSSLFGTLSSAAAALEAQRRGMDVAGQNIANVNTAGYTRRTLQLSERGASAIGEPGGGVTIAGVRAVRDVFLEARLRQEQQGVSRDGAVADALSVLEAQFGQPGTSIDAQVTAFFDAFSALADDPASLTLRDAAAREADRLGVSFRDMANRLEETRANADQNVRIGVERVNTIVRDIALNNERIASAMGADTESLVDSRNALLAELSSLVNISVTESNGSVTVALGGGQTLVSGSFVVPLQVQDESGTGLARVYSSGIDMTATITSGEIGGHLHFRDALMPGYQDALDRMAFDLSAAVNAVHTSGTDANGDPGVAIFDPIATVAGAAAAFRASAPVTADPRLIVAAGATANDIARQISGLRGGAVVDGSSPTEYWGQLVYRVGADSAAASRVVTGREQVMTQLQRLRESTSGVSLDEEAASLMRFQRAYEANARYFALVNDILDTLMEAVR
jgi:flagellar hook-associated protein 1 FlgK